MGQETTLFQQKMKGPLRLPALSKNIQSLLNAFADENISCNQLAEIISFYPEISVRIISLANSVWSSPSKPIVDIGACCIRLGMPVIKSVSIAIAVASIFDFSRSPSFDPERFWTRNMMVAEGAQLIANGLPNEQRYTEMKQAAQTAGLLHNLGLLWLTDEFSKETEQAFCLQVKDTSLTVNQALQKILGFGYCEVNAWIAEQWKLPDILAISIVHHWDSTYQGDAWEISQLLNVATQMASAIGHGLEDFPENIILNSLAIDMNQQTKIYQQLLSKHEKISEMAASLFIKK